MNRQEKDAKLTSLIKDINFDKMNVILVSADEYEYHTDITLDVAIEALDQLREAAESVGAGIASVRTKVVLVDDPSYEVMYNNLLEDIKKEYDELQELLDNSTGENRREISKKYGNTIATLSDLLMSRGVEVYD